MGCLAALGPKFISARALDRGGGSLDPGWREPRPGWRALGAGPPSRGWCDWWGLLGGARGGTRACGGAGTCCWARACGRARACGGARGALGHVQQAEGALLLEVEGLSGRGRDPADAPAELGHLGPDPRITEHPQAERQFRRADVQPPLDVQAQRHRGQVVVAELAVRRPAGRPLAVSGPPAGSGLADRRQQAENLAVPQHPRRRTELLGSG